MFLFTKTAVIKSDLPQILLLTCFSSYLSKSCSYIFSATFLFILLYIGYMHKIKLLVLWLNPLKRTSTILGLLILDWYYSL